MNVYRSILCNFLCSVSERNQRNMGMVASWDRLGIYFIISRACWQALCNNRPPQPLIPLFKKNILCPRPAAEILSSFLSDSSHIVPLVFAFKFTEGSMALIPCLIVPIHMFIEGGVTHTLYKCKQFKCWWRSACTFIWMASCAAQISKLKHRPIFRPHTYRHVCTHTLCVPSTPQMPSTSHTLTVIKVGAGTGIKINATIQ